MVTSGYTGVDSFEFGTDGDAPYLQNRSPAPSAVDVDPATSIYVEIVDDDTGNDLAETLIEVKIDAGAWQNAYAASAFQDPYDDGSSQGAAAPNGHSFDIVPDTPFTTGQVIQVRVTAKDTVGNTLGPVTYQFQTGVAPVIDQQDPAPAELDVAQLADVSFRSTDIGLGVDQTETLVQLTWDGTTHDAVIGGVAQAGYTLSEVANGSGGYAHTVTPDVAFPPATQVDVYVLVKDLGSPANQATASWSFTTAEAAYPDGWFDTTGGLLPALTRGVGQADDELGGLRATRLTAAVSAGATSFPVETVYGWPSQGKVGIDGVVYNYTGFASPTLTGITHQQGGVAVPGAKVDHRLEAAVVDLSQTYSALNQVREALLVDTAVEEYLAAIGRNLGVARYPELEDDEQYRALVKAIAYSPKGTMFGLELLLDALVGAGNYELYEELENYPNQVFVKVADAVAGLDLAYGKTFLAEPLDVAVTSDTTADLPAAPVGVSGVRLASEDLVTTMETEKPSAQVIVDYEGDGGTNPWTFVGTTEATEVIRSTNDGGYIEFQTTGSAYYKHLARLVDDTQLEGVGMLATVATGGVLNGVDGDQGCLMVSNGERTIGWGVFDDTASTFAVGLIDETGAVVGSTVVLQRDLYHELELRRAGDQVQLVIEGQVRLSEAYTGFATTSLHQVSAGVLASGLGGQPLLRVKRIRVGLSTGTDYWASRAAAGSVATADPDRLNVAKLAAFVDPDDVGKKLTIRGGTATNSYTGTNNGDFVVAAVATDQAVDLQGPAMAAGRVRSATPDRFFADDDPEAFVFPRDLGKRLVITSGAAAGTYFVKNLLHPISLDDLGSRATRTEEPTNVAVLEVSPGTPADFTSEQDLAWRLDPNFVTEASLDWELSDAGSFSGVTVTLRDALPLPSGAFTRVVQVRRSEVFSAQLLKDRDVEVTETQASPKLFDYYPFYLANPLGYIQAYLDLMTAAGVKPEIVTN